MEDQIRHGGENRSDRRDGPGPALEVGQTSTDDDSGDEERDPGKHGMRVAGEGSSDQIRQRVDLARVEPVDAFRSRGPRCEPRTDSGGCGDGYGSQGDEAQIGRTHDERRDQQVRAVIEDDRATPRVIERQTDRVEKQSASCEPHANGTEPVANVRARRGGRHERDADTGHHDERGREACAEHTGGGVEQTIPEPVHLGLGIQRSVVVHHDDAEKSEGARDVGSRPTGGGRRPGHRCQTHSTRSTVVMMSGR